MDLKGAVYRTAAVAWALLVFGGWIAVDQGYAAPSLSVSDVPGGSTGALAGALVAAVAGWMVIGYLQQGHEVDQWREVGQRAGFQPVDGKTPPELTGTVDGRTVTARYETRTRGSTEGGVSQVTFTFGEVALADAVDAGLVVGPAGEKVSAESGVGTLKFDDMAETASDVEGLVSAETDGLVLVGTSAAVVESIADGLSGRALRAMRDLEIVSAGDASGVVARWAETRNEAFAEAGSSIEYPVDNLTERIPGDAGTVTVEIEASIEDADELRRFAEGVVAIADAFEEATARTPASG